MARIRKWFLPLFEEFGERDGAYAFLFLDFKLIVFICFVDVKVLLNNVEETDARISLLGDCGCSFERRAPPFGHGHQLEVLAMLHI